MYTYIYIYIYIYIFISFFWSAADSTNGARESKFPGRAARQGPSGRIPVLQALWGGRVMFLCVFPVCFCTLFENFTGISSEFHWSFARISNWSTLNKGIKPQLGLPASGAVDPLRNPASEP